MNRWESEEAYKYIWAKIMWGENSYLSQHASLLKYPTDSLLFSWQTAKLPEKD